MTENANTQRFEAEERDAAKFDDVRMLAGFIAAGELMGRMSAGQFIDRAHYRTMARDVVALAREIADELWAGK